MVPKEAQNCVLRVIVFQCSIYWSHSPRAYALILFCSFFRVSGFFFGQHCIERTDAISFKKTSFAPFCTKVPRMDLSGWAIILARPKFMIMAARGAWLRAAGSTVFFWEETNDNGFRISCVQSFCNWIYLNWISCDKCSFKSSDIKNPKYET